MATNIPREMFDSYTVEEVQEMHDSTIIGNLPKKEWIRRALLPLRPLKPEDVFLLDWNKLVQFNRASEILVREEDGELFRRNPRTTRLQSASGKLDGKGGISWDMAG